MWLENNKPEVEDLFMKNEIITDEERENINEHICTPTHGIAECLFRHKLAERRIEKIDKGYNTLS
ncbi:MAG: hypothetical protein JST96_18240 [Bacteroidetes bacterium]|nr:hypothetical protein [Bacteroidota bacterium]